MGHDSWKGWRMYFRSGEKGNHPCFCWSGGVRLLRKLKLSLCLRYKQHIAGHWPSSWNLPFKCCRSLACYEVPKLFRMHLRKESCRLSLARLTTGTYLSVPCSYSAHSAVLCCTAVVLPWTASVNGVFNQIHTHLSKCRNGFPLRNVAKCCQCEQTDKPDKW